MTKQRWLLDENLPPSAARDLQARGIDAVHLTDVLPKGTPDEKIGPFLDKSGRTLVSSDARFVDARVKGGHAAVRLREADGRGPALANKQAITKALTTQISALDKQPLRPGELGVVSGAGLSRKPAAQPSGPRKPAVAKAVTPPAKSPSQAGQRITTRTAKAAAPPKQAPAKATPRVAKQAATPPSSAPPAKAAPRVAKVAPPPAAVKPPQQSRPPAPPPKAPGPPR